MKKRKVSKASKGASGHKRKSRSSSKSFLNKTNLIIILIILLGAYLLFSYSGEEDNYGDGELGSLRLTLKGWFLRIFGGGNECSSDSDCNNGEFCDQLTALCGENSIEFGGFDD